MIERLLGAPSSSLRPLVPDGAPPRCDRLWPAARAGGWLARASKREATGTSYWGLLAPAGRWPKPLRRLYDDDLCLWLPEIEALAWRLTDDPLLGGLDPTAPTAFALANSKPRRHNSQGRVEGYKPLRRVVTRFDDARGRPVAYAKHLRRRDGQRVAEHHRLLARWSREHRSFRLPELAMPADADVLLLAPATGCSLASIVDSGDRAAAARAATRVGRAIAGIHQCPAELRELHDRQAEIDTLSRWLAIGEQASDFGAELEAASATLNESSRALPQAPLVLSHRDLHDRQLLIADEFVTILDIDTLSLAEPELDLGNLLAHFDLLALSTGIDAWRQLGVPFVDGYQRAGGHQVDGDRLLWYRCATLLRLACVHAGRIDTRGQVENLLETARRFMATLGTASRGVL